MATKSVANNGVTKIGCMDPLAANYDPTALEACPTCCLYKSVGSPIDVGPIVDLCPTDLTCVDCTSFDWWNDTYITNHDQSLQISSPILWQHIVDIVSNSGQTFYVQTSTGELVTEACCSSAKGTFKDGVCLCQAPTEETYTPNCISTMDEFVIFVSTPEGTAFLSVNSVSIGGGLGLTNQQMNFVITNFFNTNDPASQTEARLLISNALSTTGGFYVNFGDVSNTPIPVTKGICDQIGGYWDGNASQCMCQPIVDQCDIDITQVQTTSTLDPFNNPIQIITFVESGQPISEACCNRLIKDYELPWVWQGQRCYAVAKEDCLPVAFTLNDKLMEVPPCASDLELSMWVYFGKPENPCSPIPDPPADPIVIDGVVCDITLTPNTGAIVTNGVSVVNAVDITPKTETVNVTSSTTCCYNPTNPILARISLTDPILNQFVVQTKEYNSSNDYFDRWVEIKATLPSSGLTLNFGLELEIYQGLNCCCTYDIFVDDIKVVCPIDESIITVNNLQCPGFTLNKVIDNKKSWVYNPGKSMVGTSTYDEFIRSTGEFGLLNGHGSIDRTFAPSLDADIPWRYTDYFQQSSVLENHSNLVLNTKELGLTFDMCADCPISGTTLSCPDGYILSANTSVCYRPIDCVIDNLITNSTFDYSLSGWTTSPLVDSWIWFSATTAATYNQADSGGTISQNVLTDGQMYNVSFDLVNTDGSEVYVYAGLNSYGPFTASTTVNIDVVCSGGTNFSIYTISDCGQKLFQTGNKFQFMDGKNYIFQ